MLIKMFKKYTWKQILVLAIEEYLGSLVSYLPGNEGMFLRWLVYKITFKKIGKRSFTWPNVCIRHSYNISAGDYFNVNVGSYIAGHGGIEIGDNVSIGPNVFIGSDNHPTSFPKGTSRLLMKNIPAPVKIGSDVWIGANAVICPGVTIGDKSVIGAGSVVTKDVPGSVLAVGNPAEIKRQDLSV
ncbi:acyltransferase [Candidatus Omnitrophota bacterium]